MERQRIRHACEPCRRKKTKCPGEKPACSFCQRLKQTCVYLSRDDAKNGDKFRVSKGGPSSCNKPRTAQAENNARKISTLEGLPRLPASAGSSLQDTRRTSSLLDSPSWSFDNPEPPPHVLDHFAQVYKSRIYFQPLPLFDVSGFRARLDAFPRFLRFSFLAIALQSSSHPFFAGVQTEAISYFAKSAQRTIDDNLIGGYPSIEVLQALCWLSLYLVKAKQPQAWVNIGSAARLQVMHRLVTHDQPGPHHQTDAHLRCYWSIFLLEITFSPQYATLGQDPNPPPFPQSPPIPPSNPQNCGVEYQQGQTGVEESVAPDLGINAFAIQVVSVWGETAAYLHSICRGRKENAWSSTSTFTRLTVKLYDIDAHMYQRHLLRNVGFSDRPLHELERDMEYWRPWILMQLMFHGCHALLHHPFIHLYALRGDSRTGQAGFFLQKTIDQAMFHSGWVFRLIDTCAAIGFEVENPLIGHLVAATATISWMLQFAKDNTISSNAVESMKKCEGFLQQASETWPHLAYQLINIRDLQSAAHNIRSKSSLSGANITFKPTMVWKILDYNISSLSTAAWGTQEPAGEQHGNPNTILQISTTYVHPLVEQQAGLDNTLTETPDFGGEPPNEGFGDLSLDNLLFDYFLTDSFWQQAS